MQSLEERVAFLEGRMQDHTALAADLRNSISELRVELRNSISELRVELQTEMRRLDEKVDRHFTWLVGTQVAGILAVVSAVLGLYFR